MSSEAKTADTEIRARVRSIILQTAPEPDGARTDGTLLVEHLAFHSLALLELGFALEDEFDLPTLDQSQVQHITTVEEVEELVVGLLQTGAGQDTAESRD